MRKKPKKNKRSEASKAQTANQNCELKTDNNKCEPLVNNDAKTEINQTTNQSPDQKPENSSVSILPQNSCQTINLNRLTKSRTTFLPNVCHVCKIAKPEIVCPKCDLIKYCSSEHRKAHWPSHADICQAVQKLKTREKLDHIFSHATGLTPQKFREFRYNLLMECQNMVERPLELWEREIFLYPTLCDTCHCPITQLLDVCKLCSMVAFCQRHESDKSQHEDWCSILKLFRDFITHELRNGVIKVPFPFEFAENFAKLPETAKDFIVRYNFPNNYQEIQLTQIATAPLTILFSVADVLNPPLEKRTNFTVHFIGAEIEFELEPVHKWELLFQHLLPHLRSLKLVLIGPELAKSPDLEEFTSCSGCINRNKTLNIVFEPGLLYHEYIITNRYIKPDIICIFNPGLSRSAGYNEEDSWSQTIDAMFRENVPVIMTAYTEFEIHSDLDRIEETVKVNVLKGPQKNPYTSNRPYRNFISDDCVPVIFKNYYMCVLSSENDVSVKINKHS